VLLIRKPSLYYHIQGKEDLLYTICKSSLDTIRNDVEQATARGGFVVRAGERFSAHSH
jgi:AcrR family transcriptional regulator